MANACTPDLLDIPENLLSNAQRIVFPTTKRGRKTPAVQAVYDRQVRAFADAIKAVARTLDFSVSSRGWCYLLEEFGLVKSDFDKAQVLINDCRKAGLLPLDICAEDSARSWSGIESLDYSDIADEIDWIWNMVERFLTGYQPVSFWENQTYYVQMYVEKIDLRTLFEPVCHEFHVPIANARGWSDLHLRAGMMRRFKDHEAAGRRPVLLYCGDHDPAGLLVSDSIMSNIRDLAGAVGWTPDHLLVDRFGLNRDFIDEHRLTWIENLITGSGGDLASPGHPDHAKPYVQNYIAAHGARKVEANSLVKVASKGRQLCREALMKYIDLGRVKEFDSRLELARNELNRAFADSLRAKVAS
jgi:hypothetical protein